jgi:hypothetical protein
MKLTSADSSTETTLQLRLRDATSSFSSGNALNVAMFFTSVAAIRSRVPGRPSAPFPNDCNVLAVSVVVEVTLLKNTVEPLT